MESSEEEKQAAIRKGWKVISEALGLVAERRVTLPKHTIVIVILNTKIAMPGETCINSEEILEQNNCWKGVEVE